MGLKNQSSMEQVTEFILTSFQLPRHLELILFVVLLVVFLITVAGNITIITLVCLDQRLQTPMYFFLCNLSLMEVFFVMSIIPKMLVDMVSLNKVISFFGCVAQCYFYFFFGASETILLAVVAFDHYVAICKPLRYAIIMNEWVCIDLVLGCWIGGFLAPAAPIILLYPLSFCGSNIIDHFFCDYTPVVKLSCSDVQALLALENVLCSVMLLGSLFVTLLSYVYIIGTILCMLSTKGRQKTFSTCASHITVASIFYGSSIIMYALPSQGYSQDVQMGLAVLTGVVTPLLNPFIYSLRNEKVKEAFKDCLKKRKFTL
ncbi:olfactory receptor 6M1-like [Podarcis raffonei]|uniref:olfactory receptor 6M1-like n=1 Tax=Podarcis raffonei TaxID=65483 RepID=UPI0023293531|nr:olfactory receptor 6M1-like [Podarcis raffonei]